MGEVLGVRPLQQSGASVVEDGDIKQVTPPSASIQTEAVVQSCQSRKTLRTASGSVPPPRLPQTHNSPAFTRPYCKRLLG